MKKNYFLIMGLLMILLSCGQSQQQVDQQRARIEQEKAQIEQEKALIEAKALAEKKEQERIHLEKIEVGKSLRLIELNKRLENLKNAKVEEEAVLKEIQSFTWGRTAAEKTAQIEKQSANIERLEKIIAGFENEIALVHLRETFKYQETPEGLVNHLFQSSKQKDFSDWRNLIDPYGEFNEQCYSIYLINTMPADIQKQIVDQYRNGRIINKFKVQVNSAIGEIAVGVDSDQLKKIELVKRMDKWYIKDI